MPFVQHHASFIDVLVSFNVQTHGLGGACCNLSHQPMTAPYANKNGGTIKFTHLTTVHLSIVIKPSTVDYANAGKCHSLVTSLLMQTYILSY